jgi:hypothetical protein
VASQRSIERKANWAGMNWIRQEKRLAIYLRDGLACAYCGASVEEGTQLTLDHVICHNDGGSNHESNLVTCCHRCNASRAHRKMEAFAKAVAKYVNHGVTGRQIIAHVRDCLKRPLPKEEAKQLVARRGSAAKALAKLQK